MRFLSSGVGHIRTPGTVLLCVAGCETSGLINPLESYYTVDVAKLGI